MINISALEIGKTYLLVNREGYYFKGKLERSPNCMHYVFVGGLVGATANEQVRTLAVSTANAQRWEMKGKVSDRRYGFAS